MLYYIFQEISRKEYLTYFDIIRLTSCIRMFINRMKDAMAKVPPNDQTIVGTIDRLISPGGLTVLDFLFL